MPSATTTRPRPPSTGSVISIDRFFDTAIGMHLYTASPAGHALLLANRPEMAQEEIVFYAPSIQAS